MDLPSSDNGQNRIPTIATPASLNGHSLTHIKIYYSSDNFNESTSSILGPQRR